MEIKIHSSEILKTIQIDTLTEIKELKQLINFICVTNYLKGEQMNTWLLNFSEYKGILNPLCISCKNKEICKRIVIDRLDADYTFCEGDDYINETEK